MLIWSLLVPGWSQWLRGRRSWGLTLAGWYASALVVGLSATGSPIGWGLLGFALLTHLASTAEAIERAAFPRLAVGPRAVWTAAALLVVLGCYAPWILLISWTGWPTPMVQNPLYPCLVLRGAYQTTTPRAGDRVWIAAQNGEEAGPATVIAGAGERVQRVNDAYLRPGQDRWRSPGPFLGRPVDLEFQVPRGRLLVAFDPPTNGRPGYGPVLVKLAHVTGRIAAETPRSPAPPTTDDQPGPLPNEPEVST